MLVAQTTVQVVLPPTWRHSIRWSPASPQCSQAALERVIKGERKLLSWFEISGFPRSLLGTNSPSTTHWTTWLTQQQWKTQSIFSALCPATESQWESHTFPVGTPPCHCLEFSCFSADFLSGLVVCWKLQLDCPGGLLAVRGWFGALLGAHPHPQPTTHPRSTIPSTPNPPT